jgi:hypothetical protein
MAALGLVLLIALGVERLTQPGTWALLSAIRDLGPVSGWRCAHQGAYVYDPRHEQPDDSLFGQRPEDLLAAAAPQVTVERVEADLKGTGESVVWSRIGPEEQGGERRVYVLTPGRMQAVTFDFGDVHGTVCYSHLADWRIIAEHALG